MRKLAKDKELTSIIIGLRFIVIANSIYEKESPELLMIEIMKGRSENNKVDGINNHKSDLVKIRSSGLKGLMGMNLMPNWYSTSIPPNVVDTRMDILEESMILVNEAITTMASAIAMVVYEQIGKGGNEGGSKWFC
ncbi:hypothetical protein GOBAR_AA13042 [Gossypium barbadense]|uniref:Uncharacterized protein n=1 Tax=Gossypium barbadense TaxID=3634 RepID=A0A2P5XW97_GOSBA|nr:hypothetical protein GOBAR_AA13042 [Gossypium barbadense]